MQNSLIGKILLNRYRIDSFLGRGAMAEVYKVWDSERAVHLAMKVMHADLAEDKIFVRRFKREANNLANLQHPHIVRFYGLEQDQYLVFMLMDFVEGMSLKTRIFRQEEPFTPAEIKEIFKPLASALHFAHKRGLVHCDIKPANIMLDKYGEVRLSDFGIARMSETATATMVGAGTPAYMAPEQVRGEAPTPQSDIYALGVVLYEMFTNGERPFTGDQATITGSTSEKVRWEQLNLMPLSPRVHDHKISPYVEAVILKCLEKAPAKRYQNAFELANALELAIREIAHIPPLRKKIAPHHSQAQSQKKASAQNRLNKDNLFLLGGLGALLLVIVLFLWGAIKGREMISVSSKIPPAIVHLSLTPEQNMLMTIPATITPVMMQFTEERPTATFYPTYTQPPTQTEYPTYTVLPPTSTELVYMGVTYRVVNVASNDILNIRSSPGVPEGDETANVVGTIPYNGQGIRMIDGSGVYADFATWVQIDYRGIIGWVNDDFIREE